MPGGHDDHHDHHHNGHHDDHEVRPRTALGEVLHEAEDAETHGRDERRDGEAADAVTPNTGAQERSEGE
ncbi:hypothetical protein [Streptomyces collinus]|uniref:hypothetical protein n=1 Tax=Streptomyces collinus TaxID=42684 RepID=UPI0029428337|nr:hypothetical protein [Streptomyces collinus]